VETEKKGCCKRDARVMKRKVILDNVSGSCGPGELVAILGARCVAISVDLWYSLGHPL
jgi:hypothetical protein